MNYWRANQDALIAVGVGPENADLMDPRDATYDHRDYTVAEAQEMAVWEASTHRPTNVQHLLDLMRHHCWMNDDVNRRAVLYLLDTGRLVIDREQRRVRLAAEYPDWTPPEPCVRCGVNQAQNAIVYFCVPCEDIEQAAAALREYGVAIPLPNYGNPNNVQRFCDAINALA